MDLFVCHEARLRRAPPIRSRPASGRRRHHTRAGYAAFAKASHLVDAGVYREIVDATLLFRDFREPLPAKRARFLHYLDDLRANFGDLTSPPYPMDTPSVPQRDPMRARVDALSSRYVSH